MKMNEKERFPRYGAIATDRGYHILKIFYYVTVIMTLRAIKRKKIQLNTIGIGR